MVQAEAARQLYKLEFDADDWVELQSMSFEPFEFEEGEELTRGQWLALAEMALGKALLIRKGRYGPDCAGENFYKEHWAKHLEQVAWKILNHFKPGDGQL